MRIAVCDLGSFSALFLVVEKRHNGLHPLHEEHLTIDLSYRHKTRLINGAGVSRARRVLRKFSTLVARFACDASAVVTTAAVRDATNREQVLKALNRSSPAGIKVLGPRAEARLAASGALIGLRASHLPSVVVDIGAGSTEVTWSTGVVQGIPMGAARATEAWIADLPAHAKDHDEYYRMCAARVVRGLSLEGVPKSPRVVAVGGTITSLAALKCQMCRLDVDRIHGMSMSRHWVEKTARFMSRLSQADLRTYLCFDPERARIIVAGTYLWAAILGRLDAKRVTVSARGLRWGVAAKLARLR
jgi:exopolyphosphatase/guanosine-5'-triphosphate,3'-diphosphate pyrophosphatase